ncbi:IclR family transcriptional regulator [Natronolimnobius baerhuensis]|uniref:Transcriptional regulator n=1 Tax=Natronolimnobius baerhuensis TaxID=253108 RepID=A0A202E4B5_9EURY|nr:IclR family transcriptional regulator [Natronolimnobius baerhuensis]OVE83044.1 transcriptional regulator [Natronolimnobius baerhuensis]
MANQIGSTVKTTETSFEIVRTIRDRGGATIEDLSRQLGLSESTVHRHLVTLRNHNYVVQEGDQYQIGLGFLTMGGYAQRQVTAYPKIKEKVDELAAETGERAQFIVEEHGQRVYLYTDVGESAVQTGAHVGKRGAIHTSAAGKAILANLPDDRIDTIIAEHGLSEGTTDSISSRADLYDELETIREQGYAFNQQETTEGVNAVGAAVLDSDGTVIGSLSVSGPANRIKDDWLTEELLEQVLGAVNELELDIKHAV